MGNQFETVYLQIRKLWVKMNVFKCLGTRCAIKPKLAIVAHRASETKAARWRRWKRRRRQREADEKDATKAATRRRQRRDGDRSGTFAAEERLAVNKKDKKRWQWYCCGGRKASRQERWCCNHRSLSFQVLDSQKTKKKLNLS